jgi:hypothetical protein
VLLAKCHQGDIIKAGELKEACNTQENTAVYSKSLKGREHLGDRGMETITINGQLSRYSEDYELCGRVSISGRGKNSLLSTESRPALGPIQPPIQ